MEFLKYN